MKRPSFGTMFMIFALLLASVIYVAPAMAMTHEVGPVYSVAYQDETPTTPSADLFSVLMGIVATLQASAGIGSALTFLIQLGKTWLPKYFPDNTAQNWRLSIILILALVVYLVPKFIPSTLEWFSIVNLDALAQSFADFGALLVPLFVWITDMISKKFYTGVLRGSLIGKSYSLDEAKGIKSKK